MRCVCVFGGFSEINVIFCGFWDWNFFGWERGGESLVFLTRQNYFFIIFHRNYAILFNFTLSHLKTDPITTTRPSQTPIRHYLQTLHRTTGSQIKHETQITVTKASCNDILMRHVFRHFQASHS